MNRDTPRDPADGDEDSPVEIPIDGRLDLHSIPPAHVKEVVLEYLRLCREKNILRVRIIHGKGIGNLRRTVHALLDRHPDVESYALAGEAFGGWGSTIARLRPVPEKGHRETS